jgi:hypothetical protein
MPKRKKPLRRVSKKRATLNALMNPGRTGFVLLADVCMVCRTADAIDCHEICRGAAREASLCHPRLWLALCRKHHDEMDDAKLWPIAKQIACRFQWEIEQAVFEANEVRGRPQSALTMADVAVYLRVKGM